MRSLEAEQARWFLWLPVAFGLGIAAYFQMPFEPSPTTVVVPALGALMLRAYAWRGIIGLIASAGLLAIALGCAVAKLRTEIVRAPALGKTLTNVQVDGFVELVEPRAGKGQRLTLRVIGIEKLDEAERPYRVRVRTQRENAALKPGDAVRLKASLSPPPTPSLPGDYDFSRAAWFSGLGAVGFASGAVEVLETAPPIPRGLAMSAAIERVRQAIGQRVTAALPGEVGAIANALITGERGGISEATNQAFRDSGLYHILSISGLHMTIVAGAAFIALRVLLAAVPAIALRYPIKKWAAVGAMLATLGYLLISGSAFATLRSYIMISIMFLAVLLDRPAIALRNVAVAALAILVIWPESLLDAGFQMSFAAVVALVSAYEWLRDRRQGGERNAGLLGRGLVTSLLFLGGIILTTLIASIAVAPFGIYHFHNTQAFAVLANLIAIPICNLLVMPAALAAMLAMAIGLEAGPLWLMGVGIDSMVWCARGVASLPGAVGKVAAIPTLAFVLMVLGGLWLTLWRERWRHLGWIAILAGVLVAPLAQYPDVLIGRGGDLVAVRMQDGRLSALPARGATFELGRWLEHDGDARAVAAAAKAEAWRCDDLGCTARVKGLTLAYARAPAALRDDCRDAAIVVLRFAQAGRCGSARVLVDRSAIAQAGAHALYITRGERTQREDERLPQTPSTDIRVDTVAGARGDRPWVQHVRGRDRAVEAAAPSAPEGRLDSDAP